MFPAWRLQLRSARRAVADGRWDEAAEMLASESLREFLPAKQLSQDLAGQLVERARSRMANGQSQAGWQDLNQAARLGAAEAEVGRVRAPAGRPSGSPGPSSCWPAATRPRRSASWSGWTSATWAAMIAARGR